MPFFTLILMMFFVLSGKADFAAPFSSVTVTRLGPQDFLEEKGIFYYFYLLRFIFEFYTLVGADLIEIIDPRFLSISSHFETY